MVANEKTIQELLKDLFGSDTDSSGNEEDSGDGPASREVGGCPQGLVLIKRALNSAVQVEFTLVKPVCELHLRLS
jgi:hypothetical protein